MLVDEWVRSAQALAEKAIGQDPKGTFSPRLIVRRNGEPVLIVIGDKARFVAATSRIAVAGLRGDELIFMSDTHYSLSPTNPEGKPWAHEEMQNRRHEPAVAALLREAILVARVKRGEEEVTGITLSYARENGKVRWGVDPSLDKPTSGMEGRIPEILLDGIQQPFILDNAGIPVHKAAAFFSLSTDDVYLHSAVACVKYILDVAHQKDQTLAIALGFRDPQQAAVAQERLKQWGLEVSTI